MTKATMNHGRARPTTAPMKRAGVMMANII